MAMERATMHTMRTCLFTAANGRALWAVVWFMACTLLPAHAQVRKPGFDEVFSALGAPTLLIEPGSGQIVDANPAAATFYGHGQDTLRAMRIQAINTLTDQQVAQERQLAASQGRNFFIFRHRLADGSVRTVHVNSRPIEVEGRRLLLSVIADATPNASDEETMAHYHRRLEEMVDTQTRQIEQSRVTQAWVLGAALLLQAGLIAYLWVSRRHSRQLQRQLLSTRNHLQATLNAVPDLLFEVDASGVFVSVHTAQQDNLFRTPGEFLGRTLEEVLPPAVAAMARQAMDGAALHGTSAGHEYTLSFPGGERHFELSVAAKPGTADERAGFVLIARDVTQRKADQARLQLAASVFTHAREGIVITDVQGRIVDVNDTFTRITGYAADEVLGQLPSLLKSDRQPPEFYQSMWQALADKGHWYGELWNRRKDGSLYAEMLTIGTVYGDQGQPQNYVGLFSDITTQKEHQQELEHIAHFDALTGLPNRVLLSDRLRQAMAHCLRSGQPLAVVFLDLDGFKAVNDRHGHEMGDLLLIGLAQRLNATLRDGDTLARIGGDEFVAVLVGLEAATDSALVLQRMLQAAADPVTLEGGLTLQVSASLGVTLFPQDAVDAEQLMRHADQAMYQAKQAGKNRYHLFDIANDAAIKTRTERLERVVRALRGRELVLHYQPKVNMRTGELVGAEALVRWQHPQEGLLPPSRFLPALEGLPVSAELDEWVLDEAFAQLTRWQAQGFDVPVSVNVTAASLQNAGFVQRLQTRLAQCPGLSAGHIELEVLETCALEDLVGTADVMHACRGIGVTFALDDFGTGYSSLTYLRRLPADLLKIDQSFVRDMLDDPDDLAIVQGIMGLALAFRRTVIAEGVETLAHGQRLLELGCELGQGYGIARPMPPDALPAWAAQWAAAPVWQA